MNKYLRSVLSFTEAQKSPDVVIIEVTHRCNLKCVHCYNPSDKKAATQDRTDPSSENLLRFMGTISNPGRVAIAFTGGEPLCRSDIEELVSGARAIGFENIHIDTNALLLDARKAWRMRLAGLSSVQISLDGIGESHERLRGKGTFNKLIENIPDILGVGIYVTLNMTIYPENIDQIIDAYRLSSDLGVEQFKIEPMLMKGRASCSEVMFLEGDHIKRISDIVDEIKEIEGTTLVLDNLFEAALFEDKTLGCPAARTFCHVTMEGTLFHCPVYTELAASEDNVFERGFQYVWLKSKFLNKIRDPESFRQACGDCLWLEQCCGGCHARAKISSGSFFGKDPMCDVLGKRKDRRS
ncbi:MAG: radical SAM protein [Thermodesulfobacteriota bacterium]